MRLAVVSNYERRSMDEEGIYWIEGFERLFWSLVSWYNIGVRL
jgi:hypothetical protein